MSEAQRAQFLSDAEVRRLVEASKVPSGRTATCLYCRGEGLTWGARECSGCGGHGFVRPDVQASQRRDIEVARLLDGLTVVETKSEGTTAAAFGCVALVFWFPLFLLGVAGKLAGWW